MLSIDQIKKVAGKLNRCKVKDVRDLESRLWCQFPDGYREYVTRLGQGILANSIQVLMPQRVADEMTRWRRHFEKYWPFNADNPVLPQERAIETIMIAESLEGDMIVFHPCWPTHLYILPRHEDDIVECGPSLLDAISVLLDRNKFIAPGDPIEFHWDWSDEDDEQAKSYEAEKPFGPSDPTGESLDDIVRAGQNWAKRHAAKRFASRDVRELCSKTEKAVFVSESIVLKQPGYHGSGYQASYDVLDKDTGKLAGCYEWHLDDHSYGGRYAPVDQLTKPTSR